jgi:hypothetical protein
MLELASVNRVCKMAGYLPLPCKLGTQLTSFFYDHLSRLVSLTVIPPTGMNVCRRSNLSAQCWDTDNSRGTA